MDQSRLEELRKLLQKRHQEPKRGLEQNSNGENSKAPNSEIQNSEASNFEVSNSEFLNFESPNSEVSNSKFLNYKSSNSEASNSETLDSDPDALNLEAEADQNSACENSAEQQNFILDDSGSLQQSPKARDYDKYPIILKNYEYLYQKPLMVFSLFIGGVFAIIVNFDWEAGDAVDYSANDGIYMILFLLFLSLFIILPELIDYRKERPMIQLKNNQIKFYEKDKIAYVEQCENLQHNMD